MVGDLLRMRLMNVRKSETKRDHIWRRFQDQRFHIQQLLIGLRPTLRNT